MVKLKGPEWAKKRGKKWQGTCCSGFSEAIGWIWINVRIKWTWVLQPVENIRRRLQSWMEPTRQGGAEHDWNWGGYRHRPQLIDTQAVALHPATKHMSRVYYSIKQCFFNLHRTHLLVRCWESVSKCSQKGPNRQGTYLIEHSKYLDPTYRFFPHLLPMFLPECWLKKVNIKLHKTARGAMVCYSSKTTNRHFLFAIHK